MIEEIDILEIPDKRTKGKNPNYEFAQNMVKRFYDKGMKACRITHWPDESKNINSKRTNLSQAIRKLDLKDKVEYRYDATELYLVRL